MVSLAALLLACASAVDSATPPTCEAGPSLFGRPEAATGLSDAECGPTCTCGDAPWTAPTYADADVAALLAWELTEPWPEPTEDPYLAPPDAAPGVCGVLDEGGGRYHLRTYADAAALGAAGATLTHTDACGVCSTLADLAVYMGVNDLTAPVRQCGLDNMGGDAETHLACLQELGFTRPCAWIWYWNTKNTQEVCLGECLAALDAPYNDPDGAINACLQCDEDESGPVFKAVAGRTRRNTGLPNAICRPCTEVVAIEHRY